MTQRSRLVAFTFAALSACAQILGFEDDPRLGAGGASAGGAKTSSGGKRGNGGAASAGVPISEAGATGTGGAPIGGAPNGGASTGGAVVGVDAGQAGAGAAAVGGEAGASGSPALGGRGSGGSTAAGGTLQAAGGTLSSAGGAQHGGQAGAQGTAGTSSGGTGTGGAGLGGATGVGGQVVGSGGTGNGGLLSLGGKTLGRGGLNTGEVGNTGSCFVGDTPVVMADGSQRRIDSLRIGDRVLSFDENSQQLGVGTVTETFVHPLTPALVLVNGTLLTTPEHRFYVDGEWKQARRLQPGVDALFHLERPEPAEVALVPAPLHSVSSLRGGVTTYNLEVEPAHTYFAGEVLVHNLKPQEP